MSFYPCQSRPAPIFAAPKVGALGELWGIEPYGIKSTDNDVRR